MTSITSEEVNYLIFRYLQEAGFVHSAFVFGQESFVNRTAAEIKAGAVPPGMLVSMLQRGLYYTSLEFHLEEDGKERPCNKAYSLLEPHVCEQKPVSGTAFGPPKPTSKLPSVLSTLNSVARAAQNVSSSTGSPSGTSTFEEVKKPRVKSDPDKGNNAPQQGQAKKRKQHKEHKFKDFEDQTLSGPSETSSTGNTGSVVKSEKSHVTQEEGRSHEAVPSLFKNGGKRRAASQEGSQFTSLAFKEASLLTGHESEVITCVWNPSDSISLLASASGDGTVRLWTVPADGPWNVEDAKLSVKVLDHRSGTEYNDGVNRDVTAMAWDSEGQTLATGCYDGKARLWNADGELLAILAGHQGPIFQLQFCPSNGEFLVTVGLGPAVVVWSLETRSIYLTLDHHNAPALDIDWRDSKVFATCSSDKRILLYNLDSLPDALEEAQRVLEPALALEGHTDEVNSIRWSPDGDFLVSCSDDGSARVWRVSPDLSQVKQTALLAEHTKEIYTAKWSRDGTIIATASFDGTVKVWDSRNGVCRATLRHHSQPVYAISFSPCGKYLASGGLDSTICLWSLDSYAEDGKTYKLVRLHKGRGGIFEISWSASSKRVAAGTSDPALCVFELSFHTAPLCIASGGWPLYAPIRRPGAAVIMCRAGVMAFALPATMKGASAVGNAGLPTLSSMPRINMCQVNQVNAYGSNSGAPMVQGAGASVKNRLLAANEVAWMQIASISQVMGDLDKAQSALEMILRLNPYHAGALSRLGHLFHNQRQYLQAAETYQKALSIHECSPQHGFSPLSTLTALAHCWLLLDDLPRAFNIYQQALSLPGGARDSVLWFGIGLLYDKYGADEHALEAFCAVLKLQGLLSLPSTITGAEEKSSSFPPTFNNSDTSNTLPSPMVREVFYRVAMLLRNRKSYVGARACFEYASHFPPAPLQRADVQLQLAVTLDFQGESSKARDILESLVLKEARRPVASRAKSLLGWLLVRSGPTDVEEQERGLNILKEVVQEEPADALAWYYLGRTHLLRKSYTQSYEAYQEAVYRDGQNAAYWNSIGILYLEIKQYRDALDAFSRAIHQSPSIAEVWWNLGVLYEACNNQLSDAIDAYQRAQELSPGNETIISRVTMLREASTGGKASPAPPTDVQEIDPLPFLMRPILLGAANIPPQKVQSPTTPSTQMPTSAQPPHVPSNSGTRMNNMALGRPPRPPGSGMNANNPGSGAASIPAIHPYQQPSSNYRPSSIQQPHHSHPNYPPLASANPPPLGFAARSASYHHPSSMAPRPTNDRHY